ncbi:MAG: Nif3-like dinuclear metal center hexameric protein [Candidatus Cybelea sp.]
MYLSRRRFVTLTTAGIVAAPLTARSISGAVTAQDVVDRIRKNIGVDWKPDTVDTFKAGDPSTAVTGIVTTSLASLDVLTRAVKSGANLIITSEPTFYSKADTPTPPVRRPFGQPASAPAAPLPPPPPDPVFSGKDAFIKKHNLVVFRLSDHWRLRSPDPFAQGLADTLGWSKFAAHAKQISIPETSLDALVLHTKKTLQSRGGLRVVGDAKLRVRKVALLPGSTPIQASIAALPGVDAIIAGEVREWESVEYVRDTDDLGGKKALVLTGRVVSEDPGMQLCAQWLKTIVPEAASTWISAGDPYWRPPL